MRIRNRHAPSIFPPPPDLNFNRRSFPSPPPQPKHQLPTVLQVQESYQRQQHGGDEVPLSDRTPATSNFPSVKKRSNTVAAAAAISTDDNDDDSNTSGSWKEASVVDDDNGEQLQHYSHTRGTVAKRAAADKRGSRMGAATMEGSRCSRVNGRGWRCGQQTLVGYSLCEHHLGKSRLRSLSSVKNASTCSKNNFLVVPGSNKKKKRSLDDDYDDIDDDEPLLLISNGRKKARIGTVKARSLSSLLNQTSQTTNGLLGVSQPSSVHKKKCM